MTNFTTVFCIVLIATMARPLKAGTVFSSRPSINPEISRPVDSAKLNQDASTLIKKIDPIINSKRQNDKANILNTDGLFDELASAAEAVHEELLSKESERTPNLRLILEKSEMADCQRIFENWQELGNSLWTLYSTCRLNEQEKAAMYKTKILKTTQVIDKLETYLNKLSTCVIKKELTPGPRSEICTTLVSTELPSYYSTVRSDVNTYLMASTELNWLRKRIGGDGQCGSSDMKKNFYDSSKTIISELKHCIDKHSKNART